MSDYGVTDGGFVKKRYDEIYDDVRQKLMDSLNIDVSANPQGVLNVIVGTFCDRLARLWDVAEGTYYSAFPITATGAALDAACSLSGITRKEAKPTRYRIEALLSNADSLTLEQGAVAALDTDSGVRYAVCAETTTVSKEFCGQRIITTAGVASGTTVNVIVDSVVNVSITTTGVAATDNQTLTSALEGAILGHSYPFTVWGGSTGAVITSMDSKNHVVLVTGVTDGNYYGYFPFDDTENGAYSYTGDDVTLQVTPPVTIMSLNCVTVRTGNLTETDEALKQRYMEGLQNRGAASADAIRSAVMAVEGVKGCNVVENNSDSTISSQPPHSVAVYVDYTGSIAQAIGEAIYKSVAAGIATYGSNTVYVETAGSGMAVVSYSVAGSIPTYVKIILTASGSLPADYEDLAKDAFMELVGSPTINEAVYLQDIAAKIKDRIANVVYCDIACNTDGTSTYGLRYLPKMPKNKYAFATTRITVATAS